ncbi:hypothetical protein FNF31_05842 [Cafeteria roenbergensis]|uniref:Uncharacterized protein n=1 Tax=Cafeteria roenbergensis TaxID=33653 RepID=A0A5A8CW35_CAFRO|nr:hypothetical protein FNF31_05842 [Cafeteria roenbergensis]KAA0170914.1 hypothetical protein FNF28_01187 [Cafeteria roenbergensis]
MAAAALWASADRRAWSRALDQYGSALRAVRDASKTGKKADLEALDEAVRESLPAAIAARHPPHATQPELSTLVRWKLMRGKFRPRLQGFADAADHAEVVEATTAAFEAASRVTRALLTDPKRRPAAKAAVVAALEALTSLKGVGPATASAFLAAFSPEFPFMADEALVLVGERKYTATVYADLVVSLAAKAESIAPCRAAVAAAAAAASSDAAEQQAAISPRDIADALWAVAHAPPAAAAAAATAAAERAPKRPAAGADESEPSPAEEGAKRRRPARR